MTIENIMSFIYVHKYNSFHKAANALFLTQPALSSRIQTLERELGTLLLIRNKNGVELTDAGTAFLPYALQIVTAYTHAQNILHKNQVNLVIGTNISISNTILPHVFRMLRQKYPAVSIEIVTNLPEALLTLLHSGKCDFLITQRYGLPELTEIPVYQDNISLIVPTNHPFTHFARTPDFSMVALEPMIRSSVMSNYWEMIERHFIKNGVTPNVILNADSLEIVKNMVLQGLGIAFLPELALEKELTDGTLAIVNPTPALHVERDISLIYPQGKTPPYCSFFVDACRQYKSYSNRLHPKK